MINLTKEQKEVLKYILTLSQTSNGTVRISNSISEYPHNMSDKELIKILTFLEQNNFIKIKWYSIHHNNLDYGIEITVQPDANNYTNAKNKDRRQELREWITLAIAILGLCVSIVSICLQVFQSPLEDSHLKHLPSDDVTNIQSSDSGTF